jgi:hypothetical protein
MGFVQVGAAGSFLLLVILQQSPEGTAATRDAMSFIDNAVADVHPAKLLDDVSVRKAAELLERLHDVTIEGLSCGSRSASRDSLAAGVNTTT